MNQIIDHCNFLLNNYPNRVLPYLEERATQNYFKFGYFPSLNNINLLLNYIDLNDLKSLKLIKSQESYSHINYSNYFENYELIIPFYNIYGNPIALIGRTLDDYKELGIPKYKNTQYKKSSNLFGLYEGLEEIKHNDFIILTEGQFDVIKSFDKGMKNIVAVSSSNVSQDQFLLAKRFTNNFYLALDNDDAGKIGEQRFISKYGKYCNVRKLNIPQDFKDVDEFFSICSLQDMECLL